MKKHLLVIFTFLLPVIGLQAQTMVYQVSTFAGSGVSGSANGTIPQVSFASPRGIAIDASGNVYVADCSNRVIRAISSSGAVTTFVGGGLGSAADGVGSAASFTYPTGLAFDASGNLCVADNGGNKIRRITSAGAVTTVAGSGIYGYYNGPALSSRFYFPESLVVDVAGNIYVVDAGNYLIRKISTTGVVTNFAGGGPGGGTDGTGNGASFGLPSGIAIDPSGNLYVTDWSANKIRKITPAGVVTTIAGSGVQGNEDGIGIAASFNRPKGIAIDASGNLFVSDEGSHSIRKITPSGVVTTIAGSGLAGSTDGIGTDASFSSPCGLAVDGSDNLYVADAGNNKIRKLTLVPATPPVLNINMPGSVCLGSTLNKTPTVTGSELKIDLFQNAITTNAMIDLCKGKNGTFFVLYVGDSIVHYNVIGQRIMRYDANGTLTNIRGIAVDTSNRVYAWSNGINTDAIHRIGNDGWVEFGGFITPSYSFTNITAMEVGTDGYLYVADDLNGYITKVAPLDGYMSQFSGAMQGVTSISFGKEEMYIFKASEQKIYASDLNSVNFTHVFQGLDTLNLQFDAFAYDTSGNIGIESFIVSSNTNNKVVRFINDGNGYSIQMNVASTLDYTSYQAVSQPIAVADVLNGVLWLATGGNKLVVLSVYSYKISPALPAGLSFDVLSGAIRGTALAPAPATTYTIDINSAAFGPSTKTFNFSVDATSSMNNSPGTATSSNNQADGTKINYFDINNCAEMMAIQDSKDGSVIGQVEVNQTVYPTLASFNTNQEFVRRVTEIKAQDPRAQAKITLYFTDDDITNYNSTNSPTEIDLDNNIIRGTMPVAILQLHDKGGDAVEQIKYNPITANWDASKLVWVVEIDVTKFSTFYMGTSSAVTAFNCGEVGPTTTVTSCGYYVWNEKTYTQTGIYKDTLSNRFGCDSILTLDLTVTNDFEITQDQFFPEYLYCNTTDADSYQWISCDNAGAIISEATSSSYTATDNGSYAVIATKNGCTDTSLCVTVSSLQPQVSGVTAGNVLETLSVYPNPGTGLYRIESVNHYHVTVRSSLGEVIFEKDVNGNATDIDLSAYPSGIYHLTIQSDTA